MPTIREYKTDPGYYIYARPPDAGNITYQLREPAYTIIGHLGFSHGDAIQWRVIQALKIADLIETNGDEKMPSADVSDFIPEDGGVPEIDLREFFDLVRAHARLSEDTEEKLRATLDIERSTTDDQWLNDQFNNCRSQFETEHLVEGPLDRRHVCATPAQGSLTEWEVGFIVENDSRRHSSHKHVEYLVYDVSPEEYCVAVEPSTSLSSEARAEAFQHLSVLDPIVREHFGIEAATSVSISF